MRERKYRAWNTYDSIMSYSHQYNTLAEFFRYAMQEWIEVNDYIVLHDKKGEEIYEGDIYKQIWKGEQVIGVITYGDMARFWLKPYDHYENPELVPA